MTGHRWRRHGNYSLDGKELQVEHRCTACGTVRHLWFDIWTGEAKSRWYEYPDDYCETIGAKGAKPTRTDLRAIYIRDMLKQKGSARRVERAA